MTMHRPIAKTAAETMLALQFAALATCDPDRVAAFAAFEAEGLPTRRNEAWHYTDLRSAMTEAAPSRPRPTLAGSRRRARCWRRASGSVTSGSLWSMATMPRNCPTARLRG